MVTDRGQGMELLNETAINVAGLLQVQTGSTRLYPLQLDRFVLDKDAAAERVTGDVKLTRLHDGIMARVQVHGVIAVECARCLRIYEQGFAIHFDEEFYQTVDVRTGVGLSLDRDEEDDTSRIDENHEIDLANVLRQEILVSLPMRPDCGDICPGPDRLGIADGDDPVDDRFAALEQLLGDDEAAAK